MLALLPGFLTCQVTSLEEVPRHVIQFAGDKYCNTIYVTQPALLKSKLKHAFADMQSLYPEHTQHGE